MVAGFHQSKEVREQGSKRRRQQERLPKMEASLFLTLISEMTSHHLFYSLETSLNPAHTQGEEITQGGLNTRRQELHKGAILEAPYNKLSMAKSGTI